MVYRASDNVCKLKTANPIDNPDAARDTPGTTTVENGCLVNAVQSDFQISKFLP